LVKIGPEFGSFVVISRLKCGSPGSYRFKNLIF